MKVKLDISSRILEDMVIVKPQSISDKLLTW